MQLKHHICHVWWKDGCVDYCYRRRVSDPLRDFLSELESPWSAPWGPFKLALAAGEDWSEGYKWLPSNCLTETQHIRPAGWHNLGLISLQRDVCNPIPHSISLSETTRHKMSATAPLPHTPPHPLLSSSPFWNSIHGWCLNSRPCLNSIPS